MRRVLVIGCPGAGKSTFARRLRDATGLPLYYLDMLWHKPDRTTITREEFDIRLQMILEQDEWIIDGNFARTLPIRLAYCDTVFFLDFPTGVCLEGVERRIGIKHEDMPWVEHEFDEEFRRYIIGFPTRRRPQMIAALDEAAAHHDVRIRTFTSREELTQTLADIPSGFETGDGKSMVGASIMLPLCGILGVITNEPGGGNGRCGRPRGWEHSAPVRWRKMATGES